jgi:hypothetical protein
LLNLLIIISLSFFSNSSLADWKVETLTHSANQTSRTSAMTKNSQGYELAIFKSDEGVVWMDFSLSDNSFDEFSLNELPLFQIDQHKPVQMIRGFVATIVPADEGINAIIVSNAETISTDKDFSKNHIVAERLPERVICPIYQGPDRPHLNTIEALSEGKMITFSFTLDNGEKSQTTFSLDFSILYTVI